MRQIDADALTSRLRKEYRRYPSLSGSACHDVLNMIRESPTIDAIPVSWLQDRLESEWLELLRNTEGYGDEELCIGISKILNIWKKEGGASASQR